MTASLTTIFNAALLNPGWESLLALFTINLVSSLVVVRLIYHMAAKRRDFVFTFMLVSQRCSCCVDCWQELRLTSPLRWDFSPFLASFDTGPTPSQFGK